MRGQLIDQFSLPCFFSFYCLFKPCTKLCVLPVYTSPFQSIARNLGLIWTDPLFIILPQPLIPPFSRSCYLFLSNISPIHPLLSTSITTILFQVPSSIFWITAIASKWIFPLPLLTMNNSFSTKKLLVMTQSCYDKETPKYSEFNKIYLYFSFM